MLRKLMFIILTALCFTTVAYPSAVSSNNGNTRFISGVNLGVFNGGNENDPDAIAYKKAYTLVLNEKWKDAIKEFETFLKNFPRSSWRDDANFWLCYSKDKAGYNPEDVFKCYRQFIEKYKRSKWANDARSNMIVIGQKLVQMGKVEYQSALEYLKQEDDEEISITALYALQNIGDEKALNAILKLYDTSKSENYRGKIIYALGNFDSPAAFNKLVDIAKTEPDTDLKKKAIHAIANSNRP